MKAWFSGRRPVVENPGQVEFDLLAEPRRSVLIKRDGQIDTGHIYYGWYVCAAAMFIGFVAAGARQSFGLFVVPMSDEFGWSRFEVSIAASLGVLVNGISQPFIGRIFDKTGGRKLVLASVIVLSLIHI